MNTTKIFLFKGVHAESVKVSHSMMTGLPSLTGLTGMAANFAAKLAQSLVLEPTDIVSTGVLLAIEDYQLVDGYKKGFKPGTAVYEAVPAAWANFTAHIAFEVTGATDKANEILAGGGLNEDAQSILSEMNFCKGRLTNVPLPVNLDSPRLAEFGNERERTIAMLPSFSQVVVEASSIVKDLRDVGFPLVEGLIAATLPHSRRPGAYQRFFDDESRGAGIWKLVAVQDGFLIVDPDGIGQGTRPFYSGEYGVSHVASATLGLVRLQSAASLKIAQDATPPFWTLQETPSGFFCATH